MKRTILILCLVVSALVLSVAMVSAAVDVNAKAPDFNLTDSKGESHALSDFLGKYVVLEWVNYDCPFVKKHYSYGHMQGLQKELTAKNIVWLSINSSAKGKQGFYKPEEVAEIITNSESVPTAYLYDTDGKVGKTYGAKTTPHMYVVNPEGILIYQGAIDSIPSFDSADIKQADNYVLKALDEAMAGNAVSQAVTKPYGCSVKY